MSTHYTYEIGALRSVRDENHTVPNTFYSYDAAGNLSTVRQLLASAPAGEITVSYSYDRSGNLTAVTDPNGNVTSYIYDDFRQMVRQTSPVSGQTSYSYDMAGQLLTTTDANGATTTRAYDVLGRVVTSASAAGGDVESVQWTYDDGPFGVGLVSTMTDPAGSTSYSYDRRGLLLQTNRAVGSATYSTSYGYDASGNRTRITYPSDRVVEMTFDYAGRPISATTGTTTIVSSAAYLPFGPATEIVYGNGTTKTMSYDQRYRPLVNELTAQSGPLARYAYGHDPAGNVTSLQDELDPAYDRSFAYDDLNRLTQANTGSTLWGSGAYTYDAMGNLQSSQLGSANTSFTYDGTLPKLASVTENGLLRTVTYDPAGNELSAGSTASTYSPRNHLLGSNGFRYEYDGRGVRGVTAYPSHYLATLTLSPATLYPNQSAAGTVILGAPAPSGGAIVELTSSHPMVEVPATVSLSEGSTTAVFGITQDGAPAPGTSVIITAKYGFTRQATLNIGPAPALSSLTLSPAEVTGGLASQATILLDGPAPAGGAVVHIEIDGDAASASTTVNIPEAASTASFEITTTAVAALQDVLISAIYGNTVTAHLSVRPPSLAALALEPATVMGGRPVVGQVTLDGPAPAGGATVTLASSAPLIATVPASVAVTAGQTTQPFTVATATIGTSAAVTIDATYNGTRSATLTVTPCATDIAPPPLVGSETAWIDDQLPTGAGLYGATSWNTVQKASGAQSLTHTGTSGLNVFGVSNATQTLPLTWGESLVFYVLINECAPPRKMLVQWGATDGAWGGATWGETTGGHLYMGPIPAAGEWTRIEIPASQLNLENKSIQGIWIYDYDGQAWVDRIGKSGDGCSFAAAPPPSIGSETVWVEDGVPAGATVIGATHWDSVQKASGTQSMTRPGGPGEIVVGFNNATDVLPVTWGESLVFYVLTNECLQPQKLLAQWGASDGTWAGAAWGVPTNGHLYMGALPEPGVWTRVEIPASQLLLENKSIRSFALYAYNGEAWLDRLGKSGTGCYVAPAPAPSFGSETVWADDAIPAGASAFGSPQWDTAQKASGSQSMTRPPSAGESAFGFSNATDRISLGWGDSLVFYALTNECAAPSKILAQWVASDGSWGGASWGQAQSGHVYMGALPAAGTWGRMEVPANVLNLEGTTIKTFVVYVYNGQAWIDRIGKSGQGCFPATAPAPTPGSETVWVDDALPAGASFYSTRWDTTQQASGSQSMTRSAQAGVSYLGFTNATATMAVQTGDSLVFYALTNECAPTQKIAAQWAATDGTAGGASWGLPTTGYVSMGPLPDEGEWTRFEIPATLLNLEGKEIKQIIFTIQDGQVWLDRIGKTANAPFRSTPEASHHWLDRFKARFASFSEPRISLSVTADYISTTSLSDVRRISLYTPELNLMAETEASTDAEPAIEHEYVWFGGQPVAQIATATGEIAWYFNDHLGTPILQTNSNAAIIWRAEYEPYGEVHEFRAGAAKHQPLRFPGQEAEGETAYNIFRWYRSGWGRYTQDDPIGLEGGVNLYTYAQANPAGFIDPGGLYAVALMRGLFGEAIETLMVAGIVAVGLGHVIQNTKEDDGCQCSDETRARLKGEVTKQCKTFKRTCTSQLDLATLQARRAQNLRCAYARQMMNVQCWDGGDKTHANLMKDALDSARYCDDLIEELLKRNSRKSDGDER